MPVLGTQNSQSICPKLGLLKNYNINNKARLVEPGFQLVDKRQAFLFAIHSLGLNIRKNRN